MALVQQCCRQLTHVTVVQSLPLSLFSNASTKRTDIETSQVRSRKRQWLNRLLFQNRTSLQSVACIDHVSQRPTFSMSTLHVLAECKALTSLDCSKMGGVQPDVDEEAASTWLGRCLLQRRTWPELRNLHLLVGVVGHTGMNELAITDALMGQLLSPSASPSCFYPLSSLWLDQISFAHLHAFSVLKISHLAGLHLHLRADVDACFRAVAYAIAECVSHHSQLRDLILELRTHPAVADEMVDDTDRIPTSVWKLPELERLQLTVWEEQASETVPWPRLPRIEAPRLTSIAFDCHHLPDCVRQLIDCPELQHVTITSPVSISIASEPFKSENQQAIIQLNLAVLKHQWPSLQSWSWNCPFLPLMAHPSLMALASASHYSHLFQLRISDVFVPKNPEDVIVALVQKASLRKLDLEFLLHTTSRVVSGPWPSNVVSPLQSLELNLASNMVFAEGGFPALQTLHLTSDRVQLSSLDLLRKACPHLQELQLKSAFVQSLHLTQSWPSLTELSMWWIFRAPLHVMQSTDAVHQSTVDEQLSQCAHHLPNVKTWSLCGDEHLSSFVLSRIALCAQLGHLQSLESLQFLSDDVCGVWASVCLTLLVFGSTRRYRVTWWWIFAMPCRN